MSIRAHQERDNPYVIAEIGINHDGDRYKCLQLCAAAAEAGADAVKFQYRDIGNVYMPSYQPLELGDSLLMPELQKNYISPPDLLEIVIACKKEYGLDCGISFFDEQDLLTWPVDLSVFDFGKIPSVEADNWDLIDAMLLTFDWVVCSLGCQEQSAIDSLIGRYRDSNILFLHCISNYPVKLTNANLGYIRYFKDKFGLPIGYSSHDLSCDLVPLAVSLGAVVIERHLTFDKSAQGLDHTSSSTPIEFSRMVSRCRVAAQSVNNGYGPRMLNQGEQLNLQNLGRSPYASRPLEIGTVLSPRDFVWRVPQSGVSRTDFRQLIGQPLHRRLEKGQCLSMAAVNLSFDKIIDWTLINEASVSLPVRLHDFGLIKDRFPGLESFEFHLSFDECFMLQEFLRNVPEFEFKGKRFSVHMPDYVNSTSLFDPLDDGYDRYHESLNIVDLCSNFAEKLTELSGNSTPIVGSFSQVPAGADFYERLSIFLDGYKDKGVRMLPQWLPPSAWYFGGSVDLSVMNNADSTQRIIDLGVPICLDISHFFMGMNAGLVSDSDFDRLMPWSDHFHISGALGTDGEGAPLSSLDEASLTKLMRVLTTNTAMKTVEVWKGHLNEFEGFEGELAFISSVLQNG